MQGVFDIDLMFVQLVHHCLRIVLLGRCEHINFEEFARLRQKLEQVRPVDELVCGLVAILSHYIIPLSMNQSLIQIEK